MGEIGKYIYGVINCNTHFRLFIPKSPIEEEKSRINEVYAIPYEDISAVVFDSEIFDYTFMRKDALARLLVGHQKAIERVMGLGVSIIPMKLGTFAKDENEVKDILNKGYNFVKHVAEKINNKIEIDVVATWSDFNSVLKEAAEEKEIKELKEKLLSNPKEVTVDDQMKIGSLLKKALDERRDKFAKEIEDNLKIFCVNFKTHGLMNDKMVVNIAFLVDKDKREDFDKKVEELNAQFNEKLNFRCVGPLPPYSFYTLEINKLKSEEIDWAKKRLGILNDITSKEELKKAYHRQAFSTHPDKNPNGPCAEEKFNEVNKAYKILADHCAAIEQANQKDKVPFDKEMFRENVMLVKVRE